MVVVDVVVESDDSEEVNDDRVVTEVDGRCIDPRANADVVVVVATIITATNSSNNVVEKDDTCTCIMLFSIM